MPLSQMKHSMSVTVDHLRRLWICVTLVCAHLVSPLPPHAPADPAPVVQARVLGVNSHIASRSADLRRIPAQVDLLQQTGFRWIREDIHWYRIQRTPAATDWSFTDAMVARARADDLEILAVLGHPPGWATSLQSDDPYQNSFAAPDPARFAAWAAQTVARYRGQIRYWQIWNEPDNPHFWYPAPDPVAYAALVHATATAIARVAPDAVLVSAGVNPFDTSYLRAAAAHGLWNSVDIIAIHPYVNPRDPQTAHLETAIDGLTPLMSRYGSKPVWATEIGWGSAASDRDPPDRADPQRQAAALATAIPILWRSGISHVFWYSWKDERHNPYGLYAWGSGPDDYSQPKPALAAARALLAGQLPTASTSHSTRILDFEATHDVWVRGDEHTGVLYPTSDRAAHGAGSVAIRYAFPPHSNQYLVFRRWHHRPLPSDTSALCLRVWGDTTSTHLKVWLRNGAGDRFQLLLGVAGPAGWHDLCATLPTDIAPWDRIDPAALHPVAPLTFEALVLDDFPDGSGSQGTIWVDDLRVHTP